jgi:hypothetical protein
VHLVIADDMDANTTIIIAAYEPDEMEWEAGFKRRKIQ